MITLEEHEYEDLLAEINKLKYELRYSQNIINSVHTEAILTFKDLLEWCDEGDYREFIITLRKNNCGVQFTVNIDDGQFSQTKFGKTIDACIDQMDGRLDPRKFE